MKYPEKTNMYSSWGDPTFPLMMSHSVGDLICVIGIESREILKKDS